MARARALGAPRAASLVRAGDATLAADASLPNRTGTILSFDPDESDWPLRASFVALLEVVSSEIEGHSQEAFCPESLTQLG